MKFTFLTACALAGLLSAAPVHAFDSAGTGNALLSNCSTVLQQPLVEGVAFWHCMGVLEGLVGAIRMIETMQPPMFVCLPDGVTNGQGARSIVRYLSQHSDQLHYKQGLVAMAALREAFPCPPAAR